MTTYMRPGVYTMENLTPLAGNMGIPGEACACFCCRVQHWARLLRLSSSPGLPTFAPSVTSASQAVTRLLPYAVYSYFVNGGTGCFILRVPNTDAMSAALAVTDISSDHDMVATATASSPGAWGNRPLH